MHATTLLIGIDNLKKEDEYCEIVRSLVMFHWLRIHLEY